MAKKKNSPKDATESIFKQAQKKADGLVAAAKDAADSAKKSAKKAKKSAKTADKSASSGASTSAGDGSGKSSAEQVPVTEQAPTTEDTPAAESLPLPTADDPDVPSVAWTVAKLRDAAKEQGVKGYGAMRKDQLIATLTEAG